MRLSLGLFLALLALPQFAHAEILTKAAASYNSHSRNSVSTSRLMYDLTLGYQFKGGGWVLGGMYQMDTAGTVGASEGRTSYGLSAGWMEPKEQGFYLIGTYFISSSMGSINGGSGFQGDLGFFTTLGRVPLGFQLSYKSYSYSKFNLKESYIDPYFMVMARF